MTSTAYLDGVTAACTREKAATREGAGPVPSPTALMESEFTRRHEHVCNRLRTAKKDLAAAQAEKKTFDDMKHIAWLLTTPWRIHANKELARCKMAEETASKAVADARESFRIDPQNVAAVSASIASSTAIKKRYEAAVELGALTTSLRSDLDRYHKRYPNPPEIIAFPPVPSHLGDTEIVRTERNFVKEASEKLKDAMLRLEPSRAAAAAANEILDKFAFDAKLETREDGSALIERKTRDSLTSLTNPYKYPTLHEQLTACTWPNEFLFKADWLVFWSALKAGVEYNRQASGTAINEGPKLSFWCTGWANAIGNWDIDALASLGLSEETFGNAVFMLENSTAETESGGDVLIVLAVKHEGRDYCGVASVQFKRGTKNSSVIPLSQGDGRQYDALVENYLQSGKRWRGVYASLQPDGGGLSSVPAVLIENTFVTAQTNSNTYTYDVRKEAEKSPSVNWTAQGEALATALTKCLSKTNATFGSINQVFDWAEKNLTDSLPNYVLVQAVGEVNETLKYAAKRLQQLTPKTGPKYELIESLQRRRDFEQSPASPTLQPGHGR